MKQYQVKSKKTGKIDILNEDEYTNLIKAGLEKRFIVEEIRTMRQILAPEIKKVTKKKDNEV